MNLHAIDTTFTIDNLVAAIPDMSDWAKHKAASLIQYYEKHHGHLTEGQWKFARKLVAEAGRKPETTQVGSMSRLIDLFRKASQHLQWPKIVLQTASGSPVKLSLAGQRAKHPGSITVSNGEGFHSGLNRYYGRVMPDGTWVKPFKSYPELGEVQTLLVDMSADPEAAAAKHGHMSGNCCFCNRPLKDERSTQVGYGPTCAKNFGLKWG